MTIRSKIASFSFQVGFTEAAMEVVVFRPSSSVVPSLVPSGRTSCSGGASPAAAAASALSYFLYWASSNSSWNSPIGRARLAMSTEYVALIKYGDAFSTVFSFFRAVVFKSRLFVLSTSSLFNGKTSDRSFSSKQLALRKSLKVNLARPAENLALAASSLFSMYSSQSCSSTLTIWVASISLSRT